MTTSTQQTASTSPSDDLSKSPLNDNNPSCPHCGNFAGYASQNPQDPHFPNSSLICQSCGTKNTEIDEAVYHAVLKEIKEIEKERNESMLFWQQATAGRVE